MEKYGFVYLWYDKKHKRYYIGCHWGTEDDGYVCSSWNMKAAYKRRPKDFKRRVLSKILTTKKALLEEEYRWLSLIKNEELGKRYYNLHNHHFNHWSTNEQSTLSLKEKISASVKLSLLDPAVQERKKIGYQKRNTKSSDPVTRDKRSKSMMGKNKGKITVKDSDGNIFHTTKDDPRWIAGEIWAASKGIKRPPLTEERKRRIAEQGTFKALNSKKISCIHCGAIGNVGNIGRYHNDRCKSIHVKAIGG